MKRLTAAATVTVLVFVVGALPSSRVFASWLEDGNPICTVAGMQINARVVSDGAGGAILAWEDGRGVDPGIYAQRVNESGSPMWAMDGVPICTASGYRWGVQMISDGVGGAIISWLDGRGGTGLDVYAQRVDGSGNGLWLADGVPVCSAAGEQQLARITPDGVGGAVLSWLDGRSGSSRALYAQRLSASGVVLWDVDGVCVCTTASGEQEAVITSDGRGGAIIAWTDSRGGTDIYAQRLDASGNVLWVTGGAAVCTAPGYQREPAIVSDGVGGAIVVWLDTWNSSYDIYAQRMNESGTALWMPNGVGICVRPPTQERPRAASDGGGGAIIAWYEGEFGNNFDIWAQRVDAFGNVLWVAGGVPVCTASGHQVPPEIASDGVGGAIVSWGDGRISSNWEIYAQRMDGSGSVLWTVDGVALCSVPGYQEYPEIVSDGLGGAIIAWYDERSGSDSDIYAQRVSASGCAGPTALVFVSASAVGRPNYVSLSWQMAVDVPASSFRIDRSETPDAGYTSLELEVLEDSQYSFSCVDRSVLPGKTYWYKIVLVSASGNEFYGPIAARVDAIPAAYRAYQGYPNPFNPRCTIRYDIPTAGTVNLRVFDVSGTLVRTLVDGWREPGVYSEVWNGRDDTGTELPSGIYLYCLEADDFVAARKMALLR